MKELVISNEELKIKVDPQGAELQSVQMNGLEYLWSADPLIWNRHAPVLFPIVGRLKENEYYYKGKTYPMGQHGFARDKKFILTHHTDGSIRFVLEADDSTRKVYPFFFRLYISYRLKDFKLEIIYEIENIGGEKLFFSIGGHPGFNCPIEPEQERFEDYEIDFFIPGMNSLPVYTLDNGLLKGEKKEMALEKGKRLLNYELFENDAIIFDVADAPKLSVRSRKTGKGIGLEYSDFRWLGLWTKSRDAGFLCIEPWNGIADSTGHNKDLENKLGILSLNPNEWHTAGYGIHFYTGFD